MTTEARVCACGTTYITTSAEPDCARCERRRRGEQVCIVEYCTTGIVLVEQLDGITETVAQAEDYLVQEGVSRLPYAVGAGFLRAELRWSAPRVLGQEPRRSDATVVGGPAKGRTFWAVDTETAWYDAGEGFGPDDFDPKPIEQRYREPSRPGIAAA